MSKEYKEESPKIVSAKLHAGIFLAQKNLGVDLSTKPGAKQVEMELVGQFLRVKIGKESTLVPFTNIIQINEQS